MLSYRPIDYSSDVPEIVELLKKSLSAKHTTSNFLWKHFENPFGKSYGLLACDKDKIVGVRMFMFWEFKKKSRITKAIRPVDTIIDKEYRGQGIFKKITLQGLQENKGQYDLVFNTPNTNSFPGYIKMGWEEYEKPLNYYISFVLPSSKYASNITDAGKNIFDFGSIEVEDSNLFRTNTSGNYLKWRYKSSEYAFAGYRESSSFILLVYRQKNIKGLKTLILVDYIGPNHLLKKALKGMAFKLKIFTVYYLGNKNLFKIGKKSGDSRVVYKDDHFNIHNELDFSLADLEGRL